MIGSPADITYFAEVAKTLNLSRAAERLGISQPSLSVAIKRLERDIGEVLFIRTKRGVYLTPAGKTLASKTAELFQFWNALKDIAKESHKDISGHFSLGCHPSIAIGLLSKILPAILAQYPNFNLDIRHDLSRHIVEDVISMRLDMGVAVNPTAHPDLIIKPIYTGQIGFWNTASKPSPLQDPHNGKAILIIDPSLIRSNDLIKAYKESGFKFARILTSSNLEVIADLTAQGCGIGILPIHVASRTTQELSLIKDTPHYSDKTCFVYRAENKKIRSIQLMRDSIVEQASFMQFKS